MKHLIVVLFVLIPSLCFSQEDTPQLEWLTNLDQAEKVSKRNNQPILVYFTGSDWCTPCKALKKDFFETEEFAHRAKNLVLVMIDYPRRMDIITEEQKAYNKSVMEKYNTDKSFPKLVMLNGNGKVMGILTGYSSYSSYKETSHHFAFVDEYLAKYN